MHLQELPRDVIQRRAIVADEAEVGDGGGQHPAAGEFEREMSGHWATLRKGVLPGEDIKAAGHGRLY
jgi:hypothetical protein